VFPCVGKYFSEFNSNGDEPMHWLIAIIINLASLAVPATEPTKTEQARDAKSITWQKTDGDRTK